MDYESVNVSKIVFKASHVVQFMSYNFYGMKYLCEDWTIFNASFTLDASHYLNK